ncbi:recombinase family protein [Candidatus Aerophobetes bacterium]|nr:recombinase family protein [Candidatus Aerophobetes bacterium]
MRAAGYIRVSTEEQAKEGISLDVQKEKIKAFCKVKDWNLIKIFSDKGASAKNLKREGILSLISFCERKLCDEVVIYKLDRLTRNIRDLGYLIQDVFEKNSIAFSSVQDSFDATTASGRLILNFLGCIAQWEREIIAERTKDVLSYKKDNLKVYGPTPFGFKRDGDMLVPSEKELSIVKLIYRLREKGESYQSIMDHLETKDIPTKNKKKWSKSTVYRILKNPIYKEFT